MATTPQSINAGQKGTLSLINMVDGAGNPVASLPAGSKVAYASQSIYLTVTNNPDNITGIVQAGTPPAQGTLASVQGTLTFTDAEGVVHNETSTEQFSINFDPGVPLSFSIACSTPA